MRNFILKNKFHLFFLAGLIAVNLAFFGLNLNNFFLSDDFDWLNIAKNTHNLTDYFSANYYGVRGEGGSYRPLVDLAFWLNYQIGGLNPWPYHLASLILQIGVCFLIYLLVLLLFENFEKKKTLAILAALFFSVLPSHSEAVIWLAAIADPLCSFLILLSFYFYLIFRKREKPLFFFFSLLAFILALLTKELAITLPLLILAWELFEAKGKKIFKIKDFIFKPLAYWLILLGYFAVRYFSIGLIFGYYAQEKIKLSLSLIFKMLAALITDLFFYGKMRVFLTDYFCANKLIFVYLLVILIAAVYWAFKNYKDKISFLLIAYLLFILPVLVLSFNNLNDEGERYGYLGSAIFCILLSLAILKIKNNYAQKAVLAGIIVYFGIFLINKNLTWSLAAQISEKIIKNDFPAAVDIVQNKEKILFVALPDNLNGAQVLRNGIKQAVGLFYPGYKLDAQLLNAYVCLDKENYNKKILAWTPYPTGGFRAKSIDGKNWATGFDRRETEDYTFELWNYNYNNYTSDTIRLILKKDFKIIIFDQGALKVLN